MPTTLIIEIDGIRIRIYHYDHAPAHFHVTGSDIDFTVKIETMEFIAGKFDRRAKKVLQ